MKLRHIIFISLLFVISNVGYAQPYGKTYDWESSPSAVKTDSLEHLGMIYKMTDHKIREIWINEKGEGEFYETHHLKFKILTEGAVDVYNKMEVSLYGVEEIVRLKARTVRKDGTYSDLPATAIKHISNYNESGVDYKVFVFEGLEIGSDVEYLYTFKKPASIYGYSYLQCNVDAAKEEFDLIYPSHLDFRVKTYGESVQERVDTITGSKVNFIHRNFRNEGVKGVKSESYSNWKAHLARIDYVLDKNKDAGKY